ncbi:hypothetical protein [Corynebacterium phoceense]|uniref:hypothetical protein n=1 Tax=Corynebacterium phoceense TaxID=1686286 RepID=UPI0018AA0157|nr:hypothetical protein [Corynebacterium phoceense]MBF9011334.1 hypothetical protein [Corynebacterium phoceense]
MTTINRDEWRIRQLEEQLAKRSRFDWALAAMMFIAGIAFAFIIAMPPAFMEAPQCITPQAVVR